MINAEEALPSVISLIVRESTFIKTVSVFWIHSCTLLLALLLS